jgi:hypothetical protein
MVVVEQKIFRSGDGDGNQENVATRIPSTEVYVIVVGLLVVDRLVLFCTKGEGS